MPTIRRSTATLILTALVLIAYGPSLRNELVFDDRIFMEHDPRLRSLDQAARLFVEPLWGFTDDDGRTYAHQYYRPLQTLPLALSRAAFGEAAWPSHLLNLVVHWLNVLMVWALLGRLAGSRDRGVKGSSAFIEAPRSDANSRTLEPLIPVLAAALFAVHPGYSEAVLWASNIAGLGVAACTLAILLIHRSGFARRWVAPVLIAVLFLAGLWFKEAGVLAPALMVLYDLLLAPDRGWRRARRLWPRYAVLIPPLCLYGWLRFRALGGALPGFEAVPLTAFELAINAVALLPQYVATFFWPVDLNMYHDFDAIHSIWHARFMTGLALLLVSGLTTVACWRRHAVVSFGVAWMLVTVSPHLLARWPQLNVFAERYLYLPAVGAFLIVAYALESRRWGRDEGPLAVSPAGRGRWKTRGVLQTGIAAAVVLIAIVIDVRRSADWQDEVTLYEKTLTQSRRAELIRINLGLRYYELGRYDEGIAVLRALVAFDPSWHDAWHNLGLLYLATQRDNDALAAFERARERDPSSAETLLNLGYIYDRHGRRDDALAAYFRALRVQPHNAKVWYNLATIAVELGQLDNARAALATTLRHVPDDQQARALQARLDAMPRDKAVPSPRTAQRCAEAKRVLDEGRTDEAIVLLRVAAWYDETSPLPHQYLANVYYLAGRTSQAVQHQREALARAPDNELYRRNLISLENALSGGNQ